MIGKYVHSIYSSFAGKHYFFYMLRFFVAFIKILAVSNLFKYLIAKKMFGKSKKKSIKISMTRFSWKLFKRLRQKSWIKNILNLGID